MKWALAFALAVWVLTGAAFAQDRLPVTKKILAEKAPIYDLRFEYPVTGNATIDGEISRWITKFAQGFKTTTTNDHQPQESPYTADLTYDVVRNDAKFFVVAFHYYVDTGGAHPNSSTYSFDYLMPDAWRFDLPEMLEPPGLALVSKLAIADLRRQFAAEGWDIDSLEHGADPYGFNFRSFALLTNELVVYFGPYDVAGYAAGPQQAHIPLAKLKSVMRADWRAPLPSFDCAEARTAIEQAICGDPHLARLDREVSDEYIRQTMHDADKAFIARTKAAQRAWLEKRDQDCGAAPGVVACLTAAYEARMKVLLPGQ